MTTNARRYREAASALREIRRRGGKTMATTYAIERHEATKAAAVDALVAASPLGRSLVGMLVEEESLAGRPDVKDRPELSGRLAEIRRKLRRWQDVA